MTRPEKITLGEMRASGVRRVLDEKLEQGEEPTKAAAVIAGLSCETRRRPQAGRDRQRDRSAARPMQETARYCGPTATTFLFHRWQQNFC
jgi:hypothetical protein